MPEILKSFLYHVIKMKGEAPAKNLVFLEKMQWSIIFRFYSCGPFEGGPGQMSPIPFFFIQTC